MTLKRNQFLRWIGVRAFWILCLLPMSAWSQAAVAQASLWAQVTAPLEKTKAYLSAYWSGFDQDHSLKSIVIQSKLYLTYAEIDRFTARDSAKSAIDLEQCDYYAKHAVYNAQTYFTDDGTKRRLTSILEQVNQLRSISALASEKVKYENTERQMQRVINIL